MDWAKWTLDQRQMYWSGMCKYDGELVPRDRVCALEIWCEALHGDIRFIKNSNAAEINGIVAAAGWERMKSPSKFGYCKNQRGFRRATAPTTNYKR